MDEIRPMEVAESGDGSDVAGDGESGGNVDDATVGAGVSEEETDGSDCPQGRSHPVKAAVEINISASPHLRVHCFQLNLPMIMAPCESTCLFNHRNRR